MGLKFKCIPGLRIIGIWIGILNCIFMIGCGDNSARSDESESKDPAASYGVFYPRGIRQIDMQACHLGSLPAGINTNGTNTNETNADKTNTSDTTIFIEPTEQTISDDMEPYYGCYRIAEFLPSIYWEEGTRYDRLPEQEADMMIGRIVEFREDVLVTCDSFRHFGTRDGRVSFQCNYEIEKIVIGKPEYRWNQPDTDHIDTIGRSGIVPYLARIQGKVETDIAGPGSFHKL